MTAFLFSLLILFLPTQLGKHFWPQFAFILGQRIDYLSPTIYLSDLLLMFFVLSAFLGRKKNRVGRLRLSNAWEVFLFFLVFLAFGIYSSLNPLAGWYGFFKLLELLAFSFTIRKFLSNKERFQLLNVLFSVAICFESLLAVAQFFNHGAIGGMFYFFGERFYSGITPGIANVSVNGQLFLRPYATFSHPNVLAGFLVIGMAITLTTFPYLRKSWQRILCSLALFIGSVALLFTFSRVAIILWIIALICLSIFFLAQREFHKEINVILLIFSLLVVFFILGISYPPLIQHLVQTSIAEESSRSRIFLIQASLQMVKQHPYMGVGLYNFLDNLPLYLGRNAINMLQPVHNIFLLIYSQIGIIGSTIVVWFLYKTLWRIRSMYKRVRAHNRIVPFVSLLCLGLVLNLGLFDHYFLTLQQGQLLLGLVLGICWAEFDTMNG